MKNFLKETGPNIAHFTSVLWHVVKTVTIPSPFVFKPFPCPHVGIGTSVALGREKPKRLQTGFTEPTRIMHELLAATTKLGTRLRD
jgi:hypothetical protein